MVGLSNPPGNGMAPLDLVTELVVHMVLDTDMGVGDGADDVVLVGDNKVVGSGDDGGKLSYVAAVTGLKMGDKQDSSVFLNDEVCVLDEDVRILREGKFTIVQFSDREGAVGSSNGSGMVKASVVSLRDGDVSTVTSHETRIHDGSHATITISEMGEGAQGSRKINRKTPSVCKRKLLWNALLDLVPEPDQPWLIRMDLNAIANPNKRKWVSLSTIGISRQFQNFIFYSGLVDLPFTGPLFTWSRGNLHQRLDRCMVNDSWLNNFADTNVVHLDQLCSDHCPLFLNLCRPNGSSGVLNVLYISDILSFLFSLTDLYVVSLKLFYFRKRACGSRKLVVSGFLRVIGILNTITVLLWLVGILTKSMPYAIIMGHGFRTRVSYNLWQWTFIRTYSQVKDVMAMNSLGMGGFHELSLVEKEWFVLPMDVLLYIVATIPPTASAPSDEVGRRLVQHVIVAKGYHANHACPRVLATRGLSSWVRPEEGWFSLCSDGVRRQGDGCVAYGDVIQNDQVWLLIKAERNSSYCPLVYRIELLVARD
ncbi:hypothetical protein V6N13_100920 [Hibiscus sabdariffa]